MSTQDEPNANPVSMQALARERGVALRHAGVFIAVFLMHLGVTLMIELFDRIARWGNCGPQWSAPCEGGRGVLALGAIALLGGLLLFGRIVGTAGWSGPVQSFGAVSFLGGSAGATWTFGAAALSGDHGPVGVLTLVAFTAFFGALLGLLLWQAGRVVRAGGWRAYVRYLFWYLEILPESKRKRRRLLRARGVSAGSVRDGRIEPVTERERRHWRLFVALMCTGMAGGVILGRVLVALTA